VTGEEKFLSEKKRYPQIFKKPLFQTKIVKPFSLKIKGSLGHQHFPWGKKLSAHGKSLKREDPFLEHLKNKLSFIPKPPILFKKLNLLLANKFGTIRE